MLPVCAPLGAGLDAVACFLATVAGGDSGRGRAERRAAPARFRVLRSFDVSQTGGEAATGALRGGVVGGSLERGALAVGDALEVRPGAWRKPPGEESAEGTVALAGRSSKKKDGKKKGSGGEVVAWQCMPLRTIVEGMKSDAVDLAAAAPGGLVALRTRLDPAVTRDDALVGAVAGAPGTLPAVWGPTLQLGDVRTIATLDASSAEGASSGSEDDAEPPKTKPTETDVSDEDSARPKKREAAAPPESRGFKPKKGEAVRVHAGTDTVGATVVRASRTAARIELTLARPLCADEGDVLVIETRPARGAAGWRLAAHARLAGGARCVIEGEETDAFAPAASAGTPPPDESLAPPVEALTTQRTCAIGSRARSRPRAGADAASRIKLPTPSLGRDGGAHTVWANFAAFCAALGRPPDHVAQFLVHEGGLGVARMGESAAAAAASDGTTGDGRAALRITHRGRGLRERLNSLVRLYARIYVTCGQCRSAHTQLTRGGGTLRGAKAMVVCTACSASRFVPALGKAQG